MCFDWKLLYILAAVSSNYNNEIGSLNSQIDALNQEVLDLKTHTSTTVAPITESTTQATTILVPSTTENPVARVGNST